MINWIRPSCLNWFNARHVSDTRHIQFILAAACGKWGESVARRQAIIGVQSRYASASAATASYTASRYSVHVLPPILET
jgi:hypothetical protein